MKTRGQCYYFCYDIHSFNNPCVHILSAGTHVLAFQSSICLLVKADIILLPLISNSTLSWYGFLLQPGSRDRQHGHVMKKYWRGTRDTEDTFSGWPQGISGRTGNMSQVFELTMSFTVCRFSFLSAASFLFCFSCLPPKYLLSADSSSFPAEKLFPVGVTASVMHFCRSFFSLRERIKA